MPRNPADQTAGSQPENRELGTLLAHQANYFSRLGVPAGFVFRVDGFPVDHDIEDSSRSFLQLRLNPECLPDFGRETRGARQVISLAAILDQHLHVPSPVYEMLRLHGLISRARISQLYARGRGL